MKCYLKSQLTDGGQEFVLYGEAEQIWPDLPLLKFLMWDEIDFGGKRSRIIILTPLGSEVNEPPKYHGFVNGVIWYWGINLFQELQIPDLIGELYLNQTVE